MGICQNKKISEANELDGKEIIFMGVITTKYREEKAGVYQNGNLRAFDLVPESMDSDLIFHYVKLNPAAVTEPEWNDVDKTFLILAGEAAVKLGEESQDVRKGMAVWLPQGSTHVIENGGQELEFVVVKKKNQ